MSQVRPVKLGHLVVGSTDQKSTQRFFTHGLGLKISDGVTGRAAFLRCSVDHHNVLVQQAPLNFLHHTAWEVLDIDEIGRGAAALLARRGAPVRAAGRAVSALDGSRSLACAIRRRAPRLSRSRRRRQIRRLGCRKA